MLYGANAYTIPGMRLQEVLEYEHGLYLWQLPDGSFFKNEEGEYLSIASVIGDINRMNIIRKTAEHYGAPAGGKPVFKQGARQVSKSEYEYTMERFLDGKLPDEFDKGNVDGQV